MRIEYRVPVCFHPDLRTRENPVKGRTLGQTNCVLEVFSTRVGVTRDHTRFKQIEIHSVRSCVFVAGADQKTAPSVAKSRTRICLLW
jgi:hypothetical protein